jgi:hypothetical protein
VDLENVKLKVASMSDYQLKQNISEGKDSYQEGVYQIYLDEAKKRNIEINENTIEEIKKDNLTYTGLNIVKLGYGLGLLGGIGGYIVAGIILLRKTKPERKLVYYPEEIRKHAKWIIVFTTFMIVIGWRLIGYGIGLIYNLIIGK